LSRRQQLASWFGETSCSEMSSLRRTIGSAPCFRAAGKSRLSNGGGSRTQRRSASVLHVVSMASYPSNLVVVSAPC
jgi:hypothetical protein